MLLSALRAAYDAVDQTLPGFTDCLDYMIYPAEPGDRGADTQSDQQDSVGDSVHPVTMMSEQSQEGTYEELEV